MTEKPLQIIQLEGVSTRELTNDVAALTFQTTSEGKDASVVQTELREAVRAAVETVRPHLAADAVELTTDSFTVSPRYSKSGKMDGYLGVAQVTVKGTDTAKISQLASDIKTMVVSGSKNSVSRKLRLSVESDLMSEAIADFRAKADAIASAFGHKSWAIQNAHVSVAAERTYGGGGKVMAMNAAVGMESAPMEIESGKSTMNGNVRGSIILSLAGRK